MKKWLRDFKPSRPNKILIVDILNELSHFDVFSHMDVLEIFTFNSTNVKTTLSSMHGIICKKILPLNF